MKKVKERSPEIWSAETDTITLPPVPCGIPTTFIPGFSGKGF
jgi:hypothetical protein